MRVTNFAQQNFILTQLSTLQSRTSEQNIAISSGKTAQRYSGISVDAKRLVSIEATFVKLTRFIGNNTLIEQRMQSMETAVSQLTDIAGSFRTMLIDGLNSNNAAQMGLDLQAQNLLQQVGATLNTDFDGRYLFSGSKTNVAPVDLNDVNFGTPPNSYPGAADPDYYQGDAVTLSARAGPELNIAYGIKANESGFEKLIRALKLTATATVSPNPDKARLGEALRVINEAIAEIPIIMSRIGVARGSLDTASNAHEETLLYAAQTISDLSNTDIAEAITFLTADRTSLEASLAALAQMRSISLLNFL